jgi:SOS-response transcriptional repressor LexA
MNSQGTGIKHDRKKVLEYIISYKIAHDGNSPSLRQMMAACRVTSTSNMSYILADLEKTGQIVVNPGSRGIEVIGGRWSYTPEVRECQS